MEHRPFTRPSPAARPMSADDPSNDAAVLVVGAGPAGLTLAITLARAGVRCLLVERRPELSSLPRATVVTTRCMELFRGWGLEEQVLEAADDVAWVAWECRTAAEAAGGTGIVVGLPTADQAAMLSPSAPACVAQDHLEQVLLAHLQTLPAAEVLLGTEVVDLHQGDGGDDGAVRVTLRTALPAGAGPAPSAPTREVRARLVVAADGAHSTVRRLLGIAMRGPDRLATAYTAQFRAPLWDLLGPHRYLIYSITAPGAAGVLLPAGQGDRWLYGIVEDGDDEQRRAEVHATFVELIRRAAGEDRLPVTLERTGTFRFAAQVADRWRVGNVLLIGDAAHRVTPRGGTGMNTAITDAADVGWKLAWVVKGWAVPALLDTYEQDRRPTVEHNVERSIDPLGSRRPVLGELHVDLGGRLVHTWLAGTTASAPPTSTLDLIGDGLTLLTAGADGWADAARSERRRRGEAGPPLVLHELDPMTARALGVGPRGALLVRPDAAPVALWSTDRDAGAQLAGAVDQLTGRSITDAARITVQRDVA